MCGIVGYVGDRECKELLLTGLERLEYRGYDSAGICLINGEVDITRRVGKVQVLRDAVGAAATRATTGLAHTRWATHGGVTEQNAHPIEACEGSGVTVVHNGIIENYQELRRELAESGHVFHSDTDTEVIAHLVEEMYEGDLVEAAQRAYARLRGHFAIAVAHRDHPHVLVGARRQCPLVVGVGDNEMFMASAIPAFLSETRRVQYVEDDEIVIARPGGAVFLNGERVTRSSGRSSRSTGTRTPPRSRATRRSCSRRSRSSPTRSPRRSASGCTTVSSTWTGSSSPRSGSETSTGS